MAWTVPATDCRSHGTACAGDWLPMPMAQPMLVTDRLRHGTAG